MILHTVENYQNAVKLDSVMPTDVVQTAVSADQSLVAGWTGTSKSYLLEPQPDSSIKVIDTFTTPNGRAPINGYFANGTYIVIEDDQRSLHFYNYISKTWSSASIGTVVDYCVTNASMAFILTQSSNTYTLRVSYIQQNGANANFK